MDLGTDTSSPSAQANSAIQRPPALAPDLNPTTAEANAYLASLLDRLLLLTLRDRRTIIGRLGSIDYLANILLYEAEEFPAPPPHLLSPADRAAWAAERVARGRSAVWGAEEVRKWENWERWRPRSAPSRGEGTGWGGRELGMVLARKGDWVKVELLGEGEEGELAEGVEAGDVDVQSLNDNPHREG